MDLCQLPGYGSVPPKTLKCLAVECLGLRVFPCLIQGLAAQKKCAHGNEEIFGTGLKEFLGPAILSPFPVDLTKGLIGGKRIRVVHQELFQEPLRLI